MGSNDPFMNQGHQIVTLRKRKRDIPEWTMSNLKIREVLLRAFPKLAINQKQRDNAAVWAMIIHLYFRLQWTYKQVAEELKIKPVSVRNKLNGIRRVHNGMRADTNTVRGARRRGRPRK